MPESKLTKRTHVVWIGIIALAVAAAYANSLSGPFIFDDASSIVANPTIRRLLPPWAAFAPPNAPITVQGRPVLNFSFAVNYALSGVRPWSYHALNVVIHLGAALAFFGLARRTLARFRGSRAMPIAGAAALLWAIHPLQTESVSYVVQRAESLMGLFYLLTLYAFARGCETEEAAAARSVERSPHSVRTGAAGRGWFALSFACALLGAATKEVMATAPLLVLLYDRTFVGGSFRHAWQRHRAVHLSLASTWLLLAALVLGTGGNRGGSVGFGVGIDWWAYPLTQGEAIARYLGLALWPHPLIFEYGTFWVHHVRDVLPWIAPVGVVLVATAIALRRAPPLGFLGACFFVILAPTSLAPGTTQMIVEHRMYLPLAAGVLAFVLAIDAAVRPRSAAGFMLLALPLLAVTIRRNALYHDEAALWADTIRQRPANPLAHQMLAMALERAGDRGGALEHYEAAVQLKPDFALAHDTLGLLLQRLGRRAEAAGHFATAAELQPKFADARDHFGVSLVERNRPQEALVQLNAAVALKPDFAEAHFHLANLLVDLDRRADALAHYAIAVRLKPDFPAAHYNYANTLALAGRPAAAVPHFEAAIRLRPDYAAAHCNLGTALLALGRTSAAIAEYEAALRLDPNLADARENLARVRAATK